MSQPPDGQRPPGDFYRSPAPPPAPPAPQPNEGRRKLEPEKEPPLDVRRAASHFTILGVLLMFLGVLMLTQVASTASDVKAAMDELQPDLAAEITLDQVKLMIWFAAGLLILLSIGLALTAHGLRERKAWSRPVGFTFAGILCGLGALGLVSANIPFIILGLGALWGIVMLAKPDVRNYLDPRADAFGPRTPPPGA